MWLEDAKVSYKLVCEVGRVFKKWLFFERRIFFMCGRSDVWYYCFMHYNSSWMHSAEHQHNTTKTAIQLFKEWFALVIGEIRVQLQHFRDWEKMYFYMKRFFHQELRTLICPQFRQWRDNFTTYEAISPSALRLKSHVTNIISINLRPECIKSDEG